MKILAAFYVLLSLSVARGQMNPEHHKLMKILKEIEVDNNGEASEMPNVKAGQAAFTDHENTLIESLLGKARDDPQTMDMVNRMKTEESATLKAMMGSMSKAEMMLNMRHILAELRAVDILFQDHELALVKMTKEGMVPPNRLPVYQKDPELLETDTRRGIYFSFVTMAVGLELM